MRLNLTAASPLFAPHSAVAEGKRMWRVFWAAAGGAIFGGLIVLTITSQDWLVASIRHNATWETARDWIGALSGWAAFFAAAASLPYLVGQWLEAKRQTAFIVGDADPDFLVYRNRQKRETYLTVRNWNRRRVMVGTIVILGKAGIEIDNVVDRQNSSKSWKSMKAADESGEFKIDGWTDRNREPPPDRSFIINMVQRGEPVLDHGSKLEFKISYRILGQEHERRSTRVVTSAIIEQN
ncbi:hypothetical protein [Mesorhizobium sp. KR9-304]|uniref:hypothetical protein n=1 Tax=Mesorhizobium sp. KR9-304 TaxID=3156614 RepID=UPI0032B3D345